MMPKKIIKNGLTINISKMETLKEIKNLADTLESRAKLETDLGVRAGLMQAACLAYETYNSLLLKSMENGNNINRI
jgi:hypothetical protein